MNISSFTVNGEQQYTIDSVAQMISEYIFRLKGARVKLRLVPGRHGSEVAPEDVKLFELMASYAIPAYEGGFKLKTK